MTPPRVVVLGARRRRQGLGPYVVRDLVAAGAVVPGFLATTSASRDAAARVLSTQIGVEARGYLEREALFAREAPDAVAILSPPETHAAQLEAAAAAGLHALCEKPLVWEEGPASGLAAAAARLARSFDERGLLLFENCQWPYTLAAYEALHAGALAAPPRSFAMQLQPVSTGARRLADALPHVLSMLQALAALPHLPGASSAPVGSPTLQDIEFSSSDPAAAALTLRFRFCDGGLAIQTEVELLPDDVWPRRAAYALDGRVARRGVCAEDYRLLFRDRDRSVPVRDPLGLLVADFVAALRRGEARDASRSREIVARMRLLAQILIAYERAHGG